MSYVLQGYIFYILMHNIVENCAQHSAWSRWKWIVNLREHFEWITNTNGNVPVTSVNVAAIICVCYHLRVNSPAASRDLRVAGESSQLHLFIQLPFLNREECYRFIIIIAASTVAVWPWPSQYLFPNYPVVPSLSNVYVINLCYLVPCPGHLSKAILVILSWLC